MSQEMTIEAYFAETFGLTSSTKFASLRRLGLRHRQNREMLDEWHSRISKVLTELSLN